MNKLGMSIEIELGVTGGEEDGVDNSGVENSPCTPSLKMWPSPTKPSTRWAAASP